MRALFFVIPLTAFLLVGTISLPPASAQFQSGGVDKDGEWYLGEGLEQGDYFSYRMCSWYYNECAPFVMNFWLKEDVSDGNVNKWIAEAVVYDGGKTVVGEMELYKTVPGIIDTSAELGTYRSSFNYSIAWMSDHATAHEGLMEPRAFRDINWNKWICELVCPQIRPTAIETVTVPAGTWETVLLTWRTSSEISNVWIADDFPFPIKAKVWLFWTNQDMPLLEYQFELLAHEKNVQESPFEGIVPFQDPVSGSYILSPLAQQNSGMPIQEIQCRDSRILMETLRGTPACVYLNSVETMKQRGWTMQTSNKGCVLNPYDFDQAKTIQILGERAIIHSDDLPIIPNHDPILYGFPTVVFDYPKEVEIGEVNTICVNYTFADLEHVDELPNVLETYVTMVYESGVEVLNDDMKIWDDGPVAKGHPTLEFSRYSATKTFEIDPYGHHQYKIQFKVTDPPKPRSGNFGIALHGVEIARWLYHDNGTITIGDPPPPSAVPRSSDGFEADDPYREKATGVDRGDNLPPMEPLAEFLREHILPTTDVTQWLTDEGLPRSYIDEFLEAYPEFAVQQDKS